MSKLSSKNIASTSARHTYDNYQKKWDKWDNDEFINRAPTSNRLRSCCALSRASRGWLPRETHSDAAQSAIVSLRAGGGGKRGALPTLR